MITNSSSKHILSVFIMLALAGCGGDTNELSDLTNTNEQSTDSPNVAPSIIGTPKTSAIVGALYNFRPAAADENGDELTFAINSIPPWTTFDTTTGVLSGTPGSEDVDIYSNIIISVSDGQYMQSLAPFDLTVANAAQPGEEEPPVTDEEPSGNTNEPPTITGTPNTNAIVGTLYSFQPTAFDNDGDDLVYSINTTPSWATFDTSTGTLSGVPDSTGTYADITISVSDGGQSESLAPFTISVNNLDPALVEVTLDWNSEATASSTATGYFVYYGRTSGSLNERIDVGNTTSTTLSGTDFRFADLGLYYFHVVAYNEDKTMFSLPSPEASVNITF